MKWQQMILDSYKNMYAEMEKVMDGLTVADLKKRPAPGANPIGWLCWHCIRSSDRLVGDVILGQQLWITDGWHRKFNKPADLDETGVGYSDAQVDGLYISDTQTLFDYGRSVQKPTLDYLEKLTEKELAREYPYSHEPGVNRPVHARLMGQLAHNLPHIGAASYARGIIKVQGWYGR
jgi:hypothetical protein